jgi:error-prone DNA polymerase
VPVSSLVEMADADAMRESLGLARRQALWAIKALRDEPLDLWAAAAEREAVPELDEPEVAIKPMTAGCEVVEDYRHVGLSLHRHPVEFLRADLAGRRIVTCAEAMAARDGRWLEAAGLVLVRQRPGSAKGVMFITIEDETGVANLVVWPPLFERQRRTVLSAGMMAVRGKIQREGAVVHLVAHHLTDLSADERDGGFPLPHGRGDQVRDGGSFSPDQRDLPPRTHHVRDIYIPDLQIDAIKVKTRDFR